MADKDTFLLESILESFEEIGYDGPLSDKEQLRSATNEALGSVAFIDLIEMLCSELNILLNMDESVTRPSGPNDFESFCMEMRSFVSELGCPHRPLTDDLTALYKLTNKLVLLDFLVSQLMAARLIYLRKQKKKQGLEDDLLNVNPYSVAGNLAAILRVYGISKPPSHVTVSMVLDKIITKTKELVSSAPPEYITPSLVTQGLTPKQWGRLDQINEALTEEYALRRRMLLTRCNVTVKSFKWSDKAKDKEEEFSSVYQKRLVTMPERAPVLIAKVLATKKDILSIERTSSGSVRKNTECDVNKVLMGNVPDRGGRPNETRPPPEMPSFKKRTEPSPQEKRERGGHKGGKRGGRVQGGWSGSGGKGSGGGGYQGDWSGNGQFDNNGAHWQQDSSYQGYQGGYQGADYSGYQGGYQGNDYGGYQGGHGGYQGGHGGYQGGGANQRGRGGRGGQFQRQYSAQNPRQNNSGRPHPQRQYSDQQYYYS